MKSNQQTTSQIVYLDLSASLRLCGKFLVAIAVMLMGCDKTQTAPTVAPSVPPGPGLVHGIVKFSAEILPPKIIGGDCCPGTPPITDESTVVNPDGSLKNVVVYIKAGPHIQTADPPEAVLAQIGCRYVPHVRALRTGQVMSVTNHDPTPHNVLIQSDENRSDNFQEMQGAARAVHFDHPGIVRFNCQVHPWMNAYVHVFDNPCFAVTGDDGKFEIGNLPTGTYTLVAWHEKYGIMEKAFVIADANPVVVDFEYRP